MRDSLNCTPTPTSPVSGFTVTRRYDRPDFLVTRGGLEAAIEATTVNPSGLANQAPRGPFNELSYEERKLRVQNDLPIRFGGPLYSKLKMQYWNLPHCQGQPLVLAIEAFHADDALTFGDSAITGYVYGLRQTSAWTPDGDLIISTQHVAEHTRGTKTIPSGFFTSEGAEHISAVLFTNAGTYAKFARMSYLNGRSVDQFKISREGTSYTPVPLARDPSYFCYDLDVPPFLETWGHGLVVLHNPRALHPLPDEFFADAVQTHLKDGIPSEIIPDFHIISSKTNILYVPSGVRDLERLPTFTIFPISPEAFRSHVQYRGIGDNNPHVEDGWFADSSGGLLGVIAWDRSDEDWLYVLLTREADGTYSAADVVINLESRDDARQGPYQSMATMLVGHAGNVR